MMVRQIAAVVLCAAACRTAPYEDDVVPRDLSPAPVGGVTYRAAVLPTDSIQFAVFKHTVLLDYCSLVILSSTDNHPFAATAPNGWNVTVARSFRGDCADVSGPGVVASPDVAGSVGWPNAAPLTVPCTVDVDLRLAFPGTRPAWLPGIDTFLVNDLFVSGAGCLF
jgi:hypothetical protein